MRNINNVCERARACANPKRAECYTGTNGNSFSAKNHQDSISGIARLECAVALQPEDTDEMASSGIRRTLFSARSRYVCECCEILSFSSPLPSRFFTRHLTSIFRISLRVAAFCAASFPSRVRDRVADFEKRSSSEKCFRRGIKTRSRESRARR